MFHRIIFILLIVCRPCRNFYRTTGCFQSNINIACRGRGFDLASFQLSMIAPVEKSVNHSRTVASMRETAENNIKKFVFAAIRQCEVNSLLVLLVIAFFAVTDFFRSNVGLTFSFLLVLRLSLHAVYYAKNETSEQSLYMCMFLDARPFISLQAFKLCFCLEDPQD